MRWIFLLGCSAGVSLLAGCGAGEAGVESGQPGALDSPLASFLPAPREITEDVVLSGGPLVQNGAEYADVLPHLNVRVLPPGVCAGFEPDTKPTPESSNTGLAYAIYVFNADEHPQLTHLQLVFSEAAADSCWLALANQQEQSWHWLGAYDGELVALPPLEPCLNAADQLLVAVVQRESATLEAIGLTLIPPTAKLEILPKSGHAPLYVYLYAAESVQPNADALQFAWDWEGDGVFDYTSWSLDDVTRRYEDPGQYRPTVHVSDRWGNSSTAAADLFIGPALTWYSQTVVPTDVCGPVSLAAVDARPSIAYASLADGGQLCYVQAEDLIGENWAEPTVVAEMLPENVDLVVADDRPALFFAVNTGVPGYSNWYYASATDAAGSNFNEPRLLAQDVGSGLYGGGAVVEGIPALCYYSRFAGEAVHYVRAADAAGDYWWPPRLAAEDARPLSGLGIVNGKPAFCMGRDGVASFVSAEDALGNAWAPPVLVHDYNYPDKAWYPSPADPLLAYGHPVVFIGRLDQHRFDVARAVDHAGAEWQAPVNVGNCVGAASAGVAGGRVVIAALSSTCGGRELHLTTDSTCTRWERDSQLQYQPPGGSDGYLGSPYKATAVAEIIGLSAMVALPRYGEDDRASLEFSIKR